MECCRVIAIPELEKPSFEKCRLLCDKGCSIHKQEEFPDVCEKYQCGWSVGIGSEGDRPDKSGVIVHGVESPDGLQANFYECWEGSIESDLGKSIVSRFLDKPVSIRIFQADGSIWESMAV
jgi:hypothetical protein